MIKIHAWADLHYLINCFYRIKKYWTTEDNSAGGLLTRAAQWNLFRKQLSGLQMRTGKLFFSTKTYVVGTQKNRLDETVLLSIQNTCLN